jgi:hypothetical protein
MWLNKMCEQETCLLNIDNENRHAYLGSLESLKGWETFVYKSDQSNTVLQKAFIW